MNGVNPESGRQLKAPRLAAENDRRKVPPPSTAAAAIAMDSMKRDLTASPADRLVNSLQGYSKKESKVTWLYQTSRGDGVQRREEASKDFPDGKPHTLSYTDFGKWAKGGGKDDPPDGTCNCYEIILKAAIGNKLMVVSDIVEHYQDDQQSICQYMDDVICKNKIELLSTDPSNGQERPIKGQLILFGDNKRSEAEQSPSTNIHVVTAVGNVDGPILVISHHKKDNPPIELTLDQLFKEMRGLNGQKKVFSTPQWPIR